MGIIGIKEVQFQNKSRFVGQNKTFYGISRGDYFPCKGAILCWAD
jgi:hypothetical protein